jgi:hypothetical protein
MKQRLVLSVGVAMFFASPCLAEETGQSALDDWLQSNADIGVESSYKSAEESGDLLTVQDFSFSYSTSFMADGPAVSSDDGSTTAPESVKVELTWTTPQFEAEKFTSDEDGFSVQHLSLSDDTRFVVRIESSKQNDALVDGTVEGYALTQAFWPRFPEIKEDPSHPVSRWLPLLKLALDYKIEEYRIGRLGFTVRETEKSNDPGSLLYEIRDLVLKDMRDGRIAEYSTGRATQVLTAEEDDGTPININFSVADTRITNYDFNALLTLLDPGLATSQDFELAIGSMVMLGYDIEAGPVKVNIDRIAYEDIGIRPPETDLLPLIDAAAAGAEVDPVEAGVAIFDAYRSVAIGRFSIDGVTATFPDPENPDSTGSAKLGQILVSNLNSNGLGEFSISSVNTDMGPSGAFRLGKFSIGDIEFAPYGPIRTFIRTVASQGTEPDPLEAAKVFAPLSISTAMKDFYARIPGEGEVSLDRYFLGLTTVVPPVPTEIEFSLEGLEVPVDTLDDRDAEELFAAAGIDTLRMTEAIRLRWDEQSEDLFIDNMVIELGKIGRINAKAHLGGLPKSVLQNPERIEAAIATLNLKSLELELINDGGVETAVGLAAMQAGVGENQMVDLLLDQLDGALASIGNEAFASEVSGAAEKFFAQPQSLHVRVQPDNPVPVIQIIANLEIAPEVIPDILGVTVEANR